jgi:transglutaminase-like putative cysteine protease
VLAVAAETDDHAKAALLLGFVHGSMRSENTAENPDIDVLIATRKGDCKGHARLFAVLAGRVNLPTRDVTGLA